MQCGNGERGGAARIVVIAGGLEGGQTIARQITCGGGTSPEELPPSGWSEGTRAAVTPQSGTRPAPTYGATAEQIARYNDLMTQGTVHGDDVTIDDN